MEATEETLRELLEETRGYHRSIVQTNTGAGGGGSGPVTAVVNAITLPFQVLGRAVGLVSYAFGALTRVVKDVMVGFTNVLTGLMDFGNKLMTDPSLGYFYGKLQEVASKIPILGDILGPFIGFLKKIADIQDSLFKAYQRITDIGINFGGSLTNLRQASINLALTYDETVSLMRNNSRAFHMLGSSVDDGFMAFTRMADGFRKSPFGSNLMALGYTSAQLNKGLIDYMALTGGRTSQELKNTKDLTAGANAYLEQLDGLAKLTGKSREELAEELKRKALNAAFEAKLATLQGPQKDKALAMLTTAMASGIEGAVDTVQASVVGLAGPATEAGMKFNGLVGESGSVFRQAGQIMMDSSLDVEDAQKLSAGALSAVGKDVGKYSSQTQFAIIQQGGALGTTMSQALGFANQIRNFSEQQVRDLVTGKEKGKGEAKALSDAYQSLRDLGQDIENMMSPLITGLIGPFTNIVRSLMPQFEIGVKHLTPLIKQLAEYIGKMLTQFANYITTVNIEDLGTKLTSWFNTFLDYGAQFLDWMKNFFKGDAIGNLKTEMSFILRELMIDMLSVIPGMEGIASEKRATLEAEKTEYEMKKRHAKEIADNEDAFIARERARKTKVLENYDKNVKNYEDEIAALKKKSNLSQKEKEHLADQEYKLQDLKSTKEKVDRANRLELAQAQGQRAFYQSQMDLGKANTENTLWNSLKSRVGELGEMGSNKMEGLGKSLIDIPKGANGGIFLGPKSGYPVLLHGKEAVVPLSDNVSKTELSSLTPLAQTSGDMYLQLQYLNTNIGLMLKNIKDLVEYSRRNVDATKSLNRNLFPV